MSRPFPPRHSHSGSFVRVNGKIRAREVRVIDGHDKNLGVHSLNDALAMARRQGVDLVEVSPNAAPPVCRLVDYGKFRYEQAKRDKESKRRQHASTVKEIQLSPRIDPHDLSVKVSHAVDFLCEDMKVKVALRFRGREMAHQEVGVEVVQKFLAEIATYGHPDFEPKLIGRGIHVMVSPLPRNKRARNPHSPEDVHVPAPPNASAPPAPSDAPPEHATVRTVPAPSGGGFVNNPFANLEAGRGK